MKKRISHLIIAGVLSVGILSGCGSSSEPAAGEGENDTKPKQTIVENHSSDSKGSSSPSKPPKEESNRNTEVMEQVLLESLKNSFNGSATVEFDSDSKMYKITPNHLSISSEILEMKLGQRDRSTWDSIVDNTVNTSSSIQKGLGSGYSIAMVNPSNHDKLLLVVKDGIVIYNVMDI